MISITFTPSDATLSNMLNAAKQMLRMCETGSELRLHLRDLPNNQAITVTLHLGPHNLISETYEFDKLIPVDLANISLSLEENTP